MNDDIFKMMIERFAGPFAERVAEQVVARMTAATKKPTAWPERIDINGLCEATGRAKQTLYQLNSQGQIPGAHRIGGKVYFLTSEIRPWIEAGCPKIK